MDRLVKLAAVYGVFFVEILCGGCKCRSAQVIVRANDTVKVLQIALRAVFVEHKLPEIGPLFCGSYFNDSVLVDIDSFPKRLLPATLGKIKFKFVSHPQISDLERRIADSLKPNYLYICCFEKIDSSYSVSIQSRSVLAFGGGGSVYVDIVKRGDSFIITHTSGNSIN